MTRPISHPKLEALETREVPAGISAVLSGNNLIINGTDGADTIRLRESNGIVSVNANNSTFSFQGIGIGVVTVYGLKGDDTIDASLLKRPVRLYGGEGNDQLTGTAIADALFGGAGDDTILGGGGDDGLYGQDGNDYLDGGAGADRLFGGAGVDQLFGGSGVDWLDAGCPNEVAVSGWNAYRWATNGTSVSDIAQGNIGTCSFLAAMASATEQGIDLSQRITYLGNYVYRVSLFNLTGNLVTRDVVFTGAMVRDSSGRVVDPLTANEGKFWTVLMQRAYLKFNGYDPMNGAYASSAFPGDYIQRALSIVTGRAIWQSYLPMTKPQDLAQMLARGDAITAGSNSTASGLIVGNHAYMVDAIFQENSVWKVQLYNPWGIDGLIAQGRNDGMLTIPWTVFRVSFSDIASATNL